MSRPHSFIIIIDMDTNKLITFEEYSKIKHDTPYFYALGSGEQNLLFR